MRLLFVDSQYPMFDRASADVRMFAIVRLLREQGHDCDYFVSDIDRAESTMGIEEVGRYRDALCGIGVRTLERIGFEPVLATDRYDVVFFKYFYPAEARIEQVRIWQPQARIVVDSVDLVYARLAAKADVSGQVADRREAEEIKRRELAVYAAADMVLTVTVDEARILAMELPSSPVHVVPNIHDIPSAQRLETTFPTLLFIGTFTHEPNVDGVLWFVREVWPLVQAAQPRARFRIVGGNAPESIMALAGNGVEVLGYVPDTLPYLMESWVSVAPLRFGAGMKGKVGEAMAAGLPVVATRFGAEGFGLTPGKHLFVADEPGVFAAAIVDLLSDSEVRMHIGQTGREFIEMRYSPTAVQQQLVELTNCLGRISPRSAPLAGIRRLSLVGRRWLRRNLLWRVSFRKLH